MDVVVHGTGRVAHALARAVAALPTGPDRLVGVSGRSPDAVRALADVCGVDALTTEQAVARAGLLAVAVSDDQITAAATDLAVHGTPRPGAAAVHLSGATPRTALAPLARAGWRTACWHPMQAFPSTAARVAPGTLWTLTTDDDPLAADLTRLTTRLRGQAHPLADEHRAAYHAAAALAVTATVTAVAAADDVLAACGLADAPTLPALTALVRGSLDAVDAIGPAAALTGPLPRGDVGTITRHREALRTLPTGSASGPAGDPAADPAQGTDPAGLYDAAARSALGLLVRRGVPEDTLDAVRSALREPPR